MNTIFRTIFSVLLCQVLLSQPCNAQVTSTEGETLRILGVGNSWTRDSMRWLSAIAKSAGKEIIVGHAYLGGSNLWEQYRGIDDKTFTYLHFGKEQVVHNTYQYWKYEGTEDPVKTPSDEEGYNNGFAGIGVTLESVVTDEPWDIIVFQPHVLLRYHMPQYIGFDMNDLVARIKSMMKPEVAEKVVCGIMIPFSYPKGNTHCPQHVIDVYNEGITPADQHGLDELYENMHRCIQEDAIRLVDHLGDNCSFTINVGQAIYNARQNPELSKFGYRFQRAINNTHLAEGLPKYVASLCFAYTLLGIQPDEISFYPKTSPTVSQTGKKSTAKVSESEAYQARLEAWKVCNQE